MPSFNEIPQMTREAGYAVDISWTSLAWYYSEAVLDGGLNVCPDFQRGYVWTTEQKIRYVEFILRGGQTGKNIYTNCPDFHEGGRTDYVLVDGKQRLDAVLGFLNNEFGIFGGHRYAGWSGWLRHYASFKWHVNTLATHDEVLQWYCDLNAGGTIHSPEEIARVQGLKGTGTYVHPSTAELATLGGLDRQVLQESILEEKARAEKQRIDQEAARAAEALKPKKKARRRPV